MTIMITALCHFIITGIRVLTVTAFGVTVTGIALAGAAAARRHRRARGPGGARGPLSESGWPPGHSEPSFESRWQCARGRRRRY